MSTEPQLFRINPETQESDKIKEADFTDLGWKERKHIQEWVANNPEILGGDLLIISKEFTGFDKTNERPDLLAVDIEGRLVAIELKRDDSGKDAHWQAIKYASYLSRATVEDIINMLGKYASISPADAEEQILAHIEPGSPEFINNDQRIILASHRFAAEVISAALWLNEKTATEDLITCIKLTPYHDKTTKSLYLQSSTIIPVPGLEEYIVGIGDSAEGGVVGTKYAQIQRKANRDDEITDFLRGVAERVVGDLPSEIRPDKRSQHAGGWAGQERDFRFYRLWYTGEPWINVNLCYCVHLNRKRNSDIKNWPAEVRFQYRKMGKGAAMSPTDAMDLDGRLRELKIPNSQEITMAGFGGISIGHEGEALNNTFADTLAGSLKNLVEEVTPVVNQFENDRNQEDA